jgi:hypothetical protein
MGEYKKASSFPFNGEWIITIKYRASRESKITYYDKIHRLAKIGSCISMLEKTLIARNQHNEGKIIISKNLQIEYYNGMC